MNKTNENNTDLSSKYNESQDEIKELKTKLKGNISLIEATQIVWDDIRQEVHFIWKYIHIIIQQNIMVR